MSLIPMCFVQSLEFHWASQSIKSWKAMLDNGSSDSKFIMLLPSSLFVLWKDSFFIKVAIMIDINICKIWLINDICKCDILSHPLKYATSNLY